MTTNTSTKLRTVTTVFAMVCFFTGAFAQVKEKQNESKPKEEGDRNVMLNAASANYHAKYR